MHKLRLLFNNVKLRNAYRSYSTLLNNSVNSLKSAFVYKNDVSYAKNNGIPIVALESTIITHGMPYPDNIETALEVEDVIRQQGVTPATISIINGKIHIGTSKENLEKLAKNNGEQKVKCSRRDISYIVSQKLNGGTTVSGTMLVAHQAGIPIIATGGIGGVHRKAELTFDISADLIEFARTPVAVVCAGIKLILDIPKTLEYLETQGVPVATIGQSEHFPAFYCSETFDKIKAPLRLADTRAAADLISVQRELGINTGMVLAVPIPTQFSLNPNEIESVIQKALEEAKCRQISGKNVTPFLLEHVAKFTEGRSLAANKALIKNNAKVAAEIASLLSNSIESQTKTNKKSTLSSRKNPIVIGGAVLDTTLQIKEPRLTLNGSTHRGKSHITCGGVGRNVASALLKLGLRDTRLISVVGDDDAAKMIIRSLNGQTDTLKILPHISTARYTGIISNNGECYYGIGELEAFDEITHSLITEHQTRLKEAPLIVLDGNPPLPTMATILEVASKSKIPIWYEPTDLRKAVKIFETGAPWEGTLLFVSPNRNELLQMARHFQIVTNLNDSNSLSVDDCRRICEQLTDWIPVIICTIGADGVIVSRKASAKNPFLDVDGKLIETGLIQSRVYTPLKNTQSSKIICVSGCGDCLASGIISGILDGLSETDCILKGLKAANISINSLDPVPDELSKLSGLHD